MKKFSLSFTLFCACFFCEEFQNRVETLQYFTTQEFHVHQTKHIFNERYWELAGKTQAYEEVLFLINHHQLTH